MTERYIPDPPPMEYEAEYLYRELTRISILLEIILDGQIDKTYEEPARPRDGMIRLADGVQWNPGLGRGLYWYDATLSKWVPFG